MASIYKNIEFSWVKTNDIDDYYYNNYSDYNYNPEKAFIKNNILLLEGMAYRIDYFPYRITYNLDTTGDTVSTYKMALHYDYLCDIVDVNGIQYAVTKNNNNSFVSLKKIKDFENMIFENINGVSSISTIKCCYNSSNYAYKNGDCVQVCLHDNSIFIFYPKSLYEYVGFEYDLSTNNLKQLIDMPPFYITKKYELMYIGSICFSDGDYMHFYNTSYFYTYHSYQMHVYGKDYINLLLHYIYKKNNYIKISGNFKELTDHSKDIEKFGQFGYYYNSGYIYSIDIDGNPIRLNVEKDGDKSWETFTTYKFNNGDYHLIKTNSKDALYAIGDNYYYTYIYRMDLTNGNVDSIYYLSNSSYRVCSTESFYDEINSKLYYFTNGSSNKFAVLDMPIVRDSSGNIIEKTVSTPTELYDNTTWILSNFIFDEDELCYYWVGSYKENNADVYLCKFDFNTHKIENVAIMINVCDYITYAAFTIFRYNNKISLLCAKRGLMNKERYVCDLQTKTVEIKEDVFQDLGGYYKNTYLDVCRTISNVVVGTPYGVYFWNSYPFYKYDDKNSIKCYSSYVYTENETPPEVDDPEKILNDCSWFKIENIANAGDAEKYFNIGDEKTITIDGIDYQVAIADFNHDDLTNRNSKAKISFTLKGCLGDLLPMNSTDTNVGGWGNSDLRKYLNVDFIKKLPSELSAIIKPIKKTTSKENGLSGIEITYDKIWLFSEKEIFGYTINSVDGEGKQYPYYNNEDRKNKGSSYWLRSPSQIDNENFCEVYYPTTSTIETHLSNASLQNGITFGFCIGNGGSSNATTVAPTSDKILYVTNDGSACFYGNVYAANGYFHGDVYAENGYFKGDVYADSGYFKGDIVATSLKLGSDIKIDSSNITGLPKKISDLEGSNVLLKTDDIKITTTKNNETGITTTATTFNGTTYTTYTSTDGDYVITNIGLGDKSTEGKSYFVVSKDGLLEANNAIIQGRIIANAGSIGGWNIEYDKTFGSYLQSTDSKTSGEMQLLAKNGEIRSRGNYYDTSSDGWYARLYSGKWIFGLYDSTDPWQTGDDRYSDISVNGIFMRSKQCINSGTNQYLLQADTSNDLVSITSSSSNPALSITNNSTGNCLYLENVSCGYENAAFRSKVVCNLMVDGTITESRSGYVTIFGEAAKGRIVFRTDNGTNVSGCDFEDSAIGTVGCRWGEGYFNDLYSVGAVNTSDLKLKDVIGDLDITQSIDFIKSLKPISFTFKDSEHKRIHMGFGAQDVAKSCKDLNMGDMSIYTAIGFDDDGNELYYKEDIPEEKLEWGIKYNELIAPIVKTLQYQQNIIEELQKEINELKEK